MYNFSNFGYWNENRFIIFKACGLSSHFTNCNRVHIFNDIRTNLCAELYLDLIELRLYIFQTLANFYCVSISDKDVPTLLLETPFMLHDDSLHILKYFGRTTMKALCREAVVSVIVFSTA